jgi:hypothetical protein
VIFLVGMTRKIYQYWITPAPLKIPTAQNLGKHPNKRVFSINIYLKSLRPFKSNI